MSRSPAKPDSVSWRDWLNGHGIDVEGRAYWATLNTRWKAAPREQILKLADENIQRWNRLYKLPVDPKPRVRVFRAQGKRLLVYKAGLRFAAAFTWENLILKVAKRQTKRLDGTIRARWRES